MITEAPATFEEYARTAQTRFDAGLDADFDAPDFPTRAEVEGTAPSRERFAVVDEQTACWVLRRMAGIETEAARVKAQAAARLTELEADSRALHARFDSELEAFARAEAERRRRRTVTLLDGSLCLRTIPARFTIADGEAAFCHARTAFPDAIKTVVSLDAAAYLKAATESGELLPGLDTIPARESFAVKFAGAKGGAE